MAGLVLLLAIAMSVTGPPATGEARQGRLQVLVRSERGPISGAAVRAGTATAQTDDSGIARLELPAGPTRVAIEMSGFFPATHEVRLVDGETETLEVELIAEP